MATYTEPNRPYECVISEANGQRSRETVTIVAGADLEPGSVLGKITASGKYTLYDDGNGDGSQTAVAILLAFADASGADASAAVLMHDAEIKKSLLVWHASADATSKATAYTQLANVGIIARD
jgi:hypothetical protein